MNFNMKQNKLLLLAIFFVALSVSAAAKTKQILILHTNDTHSCVMPLKPTLKDTLVAGRGGFLRRAEMIRQERKANPGLLLLDSGDFSQGSPYYSMFMGDVEIELMNKMGYDAATIGNHEFDYGLENMARIFKMASFPIVCANYDFSGTCLEKIVKPYTIIRRDGLKIGIFGIAPQLEGLVSLKNCVGVKYLNPIEKAQEMADLLKNKEKCDLVICLSHLGWGSGGESDKAMMSKTRNIDIVLGGHTHTHFKEMQFVKNLDGKEIGNDQNGKSGIFVGRILIDMKKK